MKEKETKGAKVCCERCAFFQEPKYDLETYKYTKAKCLKGMKLYYEPPSSFAEDRGLWGFVRICDKFKKKEE